MTNKEILGKAIRNHFDESIDDVNASTRINTFDKYIECRNKIIEEEMKKCRNRQNPDNIVDAILKAQNRILSELNKNLGLSPQNQDLDELLLDSITEIFCKKLGYDKNDIMGKAYYRAGGTSPMKIRDSKLELISTPCSRLNDWICRQKIEMEKISEIIDEAKGNGAVNDKNLREVLNGQCDITLEILWRMIAVPLHLNFNAFKMLAYEVLQDTVNLDSLMKIFASLVDKNSGLQEMPDPLAEMPGHPAHKKTRNRPTICIIGASGFIGSNLIQTIGTKYRLVLQFHQIPTDEMLLDIPNNAVIYIGDLKNKELTKRIFLENNIDFVFWLAASSTQQACNHYLNAYDANVDYLKCLFDLLGTKIITLKGLLLPSTCMLYMYDTSDKTIYRETDSLVCDNLPNYAQTKQRLEDFAVDMAKNHNLNIIIARMSQLYGPGDTSGRLISQSIDHMSHNEALKCAVNKIGNSPCVNLIYIDDVVNTFVNICEAALNGKYNFNECRIINIAGKRTYTVLEVLGLLRDIFNSDVEIQKEETDKLNVKIYAVDTSLAKEKVGFKPQTSLIEGLTKLKELSILNKQ